MIPGLTWKWVPLKCLQGVDFGASRREPGAYRWSFYPLLHLRSFLCWGVNIFLECLLKGLEDEGVKEWGPFPVHIAAPGSKIMPGGNRHQLVCYSISCMDGGIDGCVNVENKGKNKCFLCPVLLIYLCSQLGELQKILMLQSHFHTFSCNWFWVCPRDWDFSVFTGGSDV